MDNLFGQSGAGAQIQSIITTYGLKVLGVIIVMAVAWLISSWVQKGLTKGLARAKFDEMLGRFFGNLTRYAILVFAGIGCLGIFGIETTSFAAVLAGAGLAIGLAFQGTLSNVASGVMILIFRPFKVGDFVNAGGENGTVEEVGLFSTILKGPDNRRMIVPNSAIFGSTITNVTAMPIRRVDVSVGTDYSADISQTRAALDKAIERVSGKSEEQAHQVFLDSLGDSCVNWKVRVWAPTAAYWDIYQSLVQAVKESLDEAKIGIPFPQMDINLPSSVLTSVKAQSDAA